MRERLRKCELIARIRRINVEIKIEYAWQKRNTDLNVMHCTHMERTVLWSKKNLDKNIDRNKFCFTIKIIDTQTNCYNVIFCSITWVFNYFVNPTKLFSDPYLFKFSKLFFPCREIHSDSNYLNFICRHNIQKKD